MCQARFKCQWILSWRDIEPSGNVKEWRDREGERERIQRERKRGGGVRWWRWQSSCCLMRGGRLCFQLLLPCSLGLLLSASTPHWSNHQSTGIEYRRHGNNVESKLIIFPFYVLVPLQAYYHYRCFGNCDFFRCKRFSEPRGSQWPGGWTTGLCTRRFKVKYSAIALHYYCHLFLWIP